MSTKRNTPVSMGVRELLALRRIIHEEVAAGILAEQAPPSPPPPPPSDDTTESDTPPVGGDASAPDAAADPSMDADGTDAAGLDGMDSGTGDGGGDLDGDGLVDDGTDGADAGGMDMGGGGFGGFGGGGGGFSGGGDDLGGDDSGDDDSSGDLETTPEGEPEKRPGDPIGAAYEEAEKIAKQTTSVPTIVNAVKASIQVNFASYEEAWPLVAKLKDSGDKTLSAVADRLSLFIAGVLQEKAAGKKNRTMKISQTQLKEMIKDMIKEKKALSSDAKKKVEESVSPPPACDEEADKGKVTVTKEQLQRLVRQVVRNKLQETTGYVEQERMRQEVNILALEFLEKLTTKLNIDTGALSPEALQTYKIIHKQLEDSVRKCAAEIFQLGAVVNAAEETPS